MNTHGIIGGQAESYVGNPKLFYLILLLWFAEWQQLDNAYCLTFIFHFNFIPPNFSALTTAAVFVIGFKFQVY